MCFLITSVATCIHSIWTCTLYFVTIKQYTGILVEFRAAVYGFISDFSFNYMSKFRFFNLLL